MFQGRAVGAAVCWGAGRDSGSPAGSRKGAGQGQCLCLATAGQAARPALGVWDGVTPLGCGGARLCWCRCAGRLQVADALSWRSRRPLPGWALALPPSRWDALDKPGCCWGAGLLPSAALGQGSQAPAAAMAVNPLGISVAGCSTNHVPSGEGFSAVGAERASPPGSGGCFKAGCVCSSAEPSSRPALPARGSRPRASARAALLPRGTFPREAAPRAGDRSCLVWDWQPRRPWSIASAAAAVRPPRGPQLCLCRGCAAGSCRGVTWISASP